MDALPVEQANQDAFGLGGFDGGYEIAVSRDNGGFLDETLRRRRSQRESINRAASPPKRRRQAFAVGGFHVGYGDG